jgi:hypothetical protein
MPCQQGDTACGLLPFALFAPSPFVVRKGATCALLSPSSPRALLGRKFCLRHTIFAHFAFAILKFDILLLPHFPPLRGKSKSKSKTATKGAKANRNFTIFILLLPHRGQKWCYKELQGKSKMSKFRVTKAKCAKMSVAKIKFSLY